MWQPVDKRTQAGFLCIGNRCDAEYPHQKSQLIADALQLLPMFITTDQQQARARILQDIGNVLRDGLPCTAESPPDPAPMPPDRTTPIRGNYAATRPHDRHAPTLQAQCRLPARHIVAHLRPGAIEPTLRLGIELTISDCIRTAAYAFTKQARRGCSASCWKDDIGCADSHRCSAYNLFLVVDSIPDRE